jgi:hypothetical protein
MLAPQGSSEVFTCIVSVAPPAYAHSDAQGDSELEGQEVLKAAHRIGADHGQRNLSLNILG